MGKALDERVLRSKAQSLICAVGLSRAKSGLSAEGIDAIMLRRSGLQERVMGFVTNAGVNLVLTSKAIEVA